MITLSDTWCIRDQCSKAKGHKSIMCEPHALNGKCTCGSDAGVIPQAYPKVAKFLGA